MAQALVLSGLAQVSDVAGASAMRALFGTAALIAEWALVRRASFCQARASLRSLTETTQQAVRVNRDAARALARHVNECVTAINGLTTELNNELSEGMLQALEDLER